MAAESARCQTHAAGKAHKLANPLLPFNIFCMRELDLTNTAACVHRKWHPDRNNDNKEKAEQKFTEVQAYTRPTRETCLRSTLGCTFSFSDSAVH